jgi:hypothetical protein
MLVEDVCKDAIGLLLVVTEEDGYESRLGRSPAVKVFVRFL